MSYEVDILIVYADIVFIENLIINYVILYVTTLLKKIKVSYFRILLSAICGSVYAIVSIIVSDNIISKIILSIVMILKVFRNISDFLFGFNYHRRSVYSYIIFSEWL